jgi:hypothetical protein
MNHLILISKESFMKTKRVLAGIISILLLFTLVVVGFDNGSTSDDRVIGTATLNGNTLTVRLNDNSGYPGEYYVTRPSGTTGDVTGTYTGQFDIYTATLVVTATEWVLSVPSAMMYESGTYTLNGSTATLRVSN